MKILFTAVVLVLLYSCNVTFRTLQPTGDITERVYKRSEVRRYQKNTAQGLDDSIAVVRKTEFPNPYQYHNK